MDIMDGLSGWLRQVIAVILLASLIDLLLPNRTMQRYVRLVAGLFILLTVATPIMQWIKGDIGTKLAEGLRSVEKEPDGADRQLAMIEANGAKLRESRMTQAAQLTAARLESEIKREVEQAGGRAVRRVAVGLEKVSDGTLAVAKVSIELEPGDSEIPVDGETASADPIREVQAVADVEIEVDVGEIHASNAGRDQPVMASEVDEGARPDRETRQSIAALVSQKFGIAQSYVEVKLPGED